MNVIVKMDSKISQHDVRFVYMAKKLKTRHIMNIWNITWNELNYSALKIIQFNTPERDIKKMIIY